jgi:hypothetical protein
MANKTSLLKISAFQPEGIRSTFDLFQKKSRDKNKKNLNKVEFSKFKSADS